MHQVNNSPVFFGVLISFGDLDFFRFHFPKLIPVELFPCWHWHWNGFDMRGGEPSNVRVSRIYLGQFSAPAQRCDIPTLCQNYHTAVSVSACSLLLRFFSPSLNSPVWKITSPLTPAASLPSVLSSVNVLTRPTESPEGKKQNLLSHCSGSFSRSMTTGQDVRVWHFLHS